jgi:drug/metabolite transporter (DMT)-like permease
MKPHGAEGTTDMDDEQKGMLAATAAFIIFGFSYLFSKMALNLTEPAILLGARFLVTFVALNLLVLSRVMKVNFKGKPIGAAILLGVVQPVFYFIFENYGLKYTTTSFTGMVSAISPIFTAILGAIFLKERPNLKQWAFILVSIAGVMMVSVGGSGGQNTVLGAACLVAAYLSGAVYTLLVRRYSRVFTAFELTYMMFMVGFAFFTGWAFVQFRGQTVPMLREALSHGQFIVSALYLGVAASVFAYLLANYSIGKLPVARAMIFGNVSTVVSVIAGVAFMGDKFGVAQALAFLLILAGVWGVNRLRTRT